MERDRKYNQRNDTLPGTKTQNKKPIGTKKTGNVLLDWMQCIELRGLELSTNLGTDNKFGHRQDNCCPKGEIAKNASTSIFIQIFIVYNQM